MDSFPDLQTANELHYNHDVNPPPQQPLQFHPPYSEMIIAAICALKDKDGSSRQAIAKYIEKEYTNLPPAHPAMLTNHLKLMKTKGELIMVKHSYMLPPSMSSVPPFQDHAYTVNTSVDNDFFAYANAYATIESVVNAIADAGSNLNTNIAGENSAGVTPRRKPGRPPKPRQDFGFQPNLDGVQGFQPQTDGGASIDSSSFANANANANADVGSNVNTTIGGGNSAVITPRRKAGRPPKPRHDFGLQPHLAGVHDFQPQTDDGAPQQQEALQGDAEPVFAPSGLADDGVAPPPENENVTVVSAKRGRGRPPKSVASGTGVGDVGGSGKVVELEKKKPGRRKFMSVGSVRSGGPKRIEGSETLALPLSVDVASPSGRPKRSVRKPQTLYDISRGVGTGSVSNGRGRPPKSKFRKLTSSSFGHPTKVGLGTAIIVKDPHQLVAYQELKSKYEHLQSKAKEVMGVVRPYVNPEYEAFGALQELESLMG